MGKLKDYIPRIDRVWLITWSFIYVGFLLADAIMPDSIGVTLLKYTGVVLCLIYAVRKFPKDYLLQIALFFTLLADTILVVDNTSLNGVFVFCVAQFFHLIRLTQTRPNPHSFTLYLLIVLLIYIFGATQHIPAAFVIGFIYAASIGINLYQAFRWHRNTHSTPATCALYGFILFAICDTFVMLSYFSVTGVISPIFTLPANYFAWAFYYPSQVLISNSSKLLQEKSRL